jgi:hypothetical protein
MGNTLVVRCQMVSKGDLLGTQYDAEKTKRHLKSSGTSVQRNVRPFKSPVPCRVRHALTSSARELCTKVSGT